MSESSAPTAASFAQPTPIKLSVNALVVSPLRVRWQAARSLWRYHGCWRMALIRQRLHAELLREVEETVPLVLILSLIAGILIFVVLPASLRDQVESILSTLWPVWVVQVAPMVCALLLCLLNAPAIALRYVELHARGYFPSDSQLRDLRMAALAVPQILSHGLLCAACACLMVAFSLLFGTIAELVLAVADLRQVMQTVLSSVSPLAWLRSLAQAAILGSMCALAACLLAWPGSLSAQNARDTHRIGLLAIIVSTASCVASGLGLNWIANLLGWDPYAI